MKKWIIVVCVITIGAVIVSCQKPDAPQFKEFSDLDIKLNGFTSADITAEATFYNPNNTAITLKEIDVNVEFDETPITRFSKQLDMKIKGESDFTIPVDLAVSFKSLTIQEVLGLFKKDRGPIMLHFIGSARIKMYGIPFTVPVDHYQEFDESL